MKTLSMLAVLTLTAYGAAAEEGGDCCKMMMKKAPAPEAKPCCCCMKMQANAQPAKATDLNGLVEQLKSAKGDDLVDALAAVLNKVKEDRKADGQEAPPAEAPAAAHQH